MLTVWPFFCYKALNISNYVGIDTLICETLVVDKIYYIRPTLKDDT